MRADVSRDTFDPAKHYRGVRRQQGRVDLDADWNEQADLVDHLVTGTTGDLVGTSGGPAGAAAFGLSAAGTDLRLTAGTYYVDGVRLEADAECSVWDQPDLPAGAPLVRLDDGTDVAGPTPPAGRYLAYLAVRTVLVTALEDPEIREVALGGPDTGTRLRTVWQVKLLRLGAAGDPVDCGTVTPQWTALTARPTGRLEVRAQPGDDSAGPCVVPAEAGFRLLRNNNYRFEIVRSGQTGAAQFTWSRDNGSTVASWTGQDGNLLTLAVPGRDRLAGFEPGALVELTDDEHELLGRPGFFTTVVRVTGDRIEVAAPDGTPELDLSTYRTHPKVRAWDSGAVLPVTRPAADGGWLDVEGGVQVRWTGGSATYQAGTWWNAPARTLLGDVLWPREAGGPRALPPRGADTRFARLGLATFDGTAWTDLHDCRPLFAPLTAQTTLAYVSGDGQDATPAPGALIPLDQPLVVGVATGSVPVPGARVRFAVTAGAGTLSATEVVTDAAGLASVTWSVDSATASQQVTATLLTDGGGSLGLPVRFTAELLTAAGVAYEPGACAALTGVKTVQEALDTLCATSAAGCATVTVPPGDNLVEVLEAFGPGQDVHVCLQPGEYVLRATAELTRLGHVRITGAGEGTRIVGEKLEVALLLRRCASVEISDLAVRTTAVDVNPKAKAPGVAWGDGIGGSITVFDTPRVRLDRITAQCAGAPSYGAACLTVRPDELAEPLESVRVTGCDLRVGHRQAGLLLANIRRATVRDNTVTVVDEPDLRAPVRLVLDERARARLARQLVSDPVLATGRVEPGPGRNTVLRVGDFLVRMQSAVPVAQWRALLDADPPTAEETASVDGVRTFMDRITAATVTEPARLPGFREQLTRLRRTQAGRGFLETDAGQRFVTGLVVNDLDIAAVGDVTGQRRQVGVAVGEHRIRFDSPLPQAEWDRLLAELPARRLRSAADLLRHLRLVSRRVVTDGELRGRFAGAADWFDRLDEPAAATYGVVCGGTVLEELTVAGLTVDRVLTGLRVGVGGTVAAPGSAGTLRISDAGVVLGGPATAEPRQGVSVGNVRHLIVRDSVVAFQSPTVGFLKHHGISVLGRLGALLSIRSNRVSGGANANATAIQVTSLDGSTSPAQWVVADNVTSTLIAVDPLVRRVDNVIGVP